MARKIQAVATRATVLFAWRPAHASLHPACSSLTTAAALAIALLAHPVIAATQAPQQQQARTQDQSPATLSGSVTDPSAALIPAATLILNSATQTPQLTATTDAQGSYRFPAILPGDYQLTVSARGFRAEQRNFHLAPGETLRLDIPLRIDIQKQQVDVSAGQLDAAPDRNRSAIIFSASDLQSLSTNPADLQTQLQLFAGSDPTTPPQLFVDGFTAGRLPPKSSIREVRINQNPYSAQYDATGMGRIEVFTAPGGDTLHGSLTLMGDDSSLNSRNPFVTGQPAYAAFYTEGAVSGRLTRASSWYLTGDRQDVGAQSFVHATTSTNAPPYTATLESPQTSTDAGPRLDAQLGHIHTVSLRYQFGRQAQDNLLQDPLALLSQAIATRHTDQTIQLSDTQAWTENAVNEIRFQFARINDSSVAANSAPSILVQGAFEGGGSPINHLHDGQNRYELQDYFSLLRGPHLFRLGARLRSTRDNNTSSADYNGVYIFSSLAAYETTTQGLASGLTPAQIRAAGGGASQFTYALGQPRVNVNVADLGLHAEDEWRPTRNTTLDAGLRYEMQSRIRDHQDYAPRLGWSWAIGGNHGPNHDKPAWAVLRAGIGIFYQRFGVADVAIARRENGITQQQFTVADPDFYPAVPPPNALGPAAQPILYRLGERLRAPYILQQGVSIDKDFKRLTLSLDYTWYHGVDQFLVPNVNAPLPGTYTPGDPSSGIRPLGNLENIYEFQSEGVSNRHRLLANIHYRTGPVTFYGIYSFGYSKADTTGDSYTPSNQYNYRADYGRAANDLRNRAYFGGLTNLPWKFSAEPFLVLESSMPFNITTGIDRNGDSQYNDRPAFATDLTRPSVYRTKFGNFDADPLPGQKIIPINSGTGPSVAMLQMQVTRAFAFGPRTPSQSAGAAASPGNAPRRYQANLGIQAQNILNIVNGGPPVGVLGSPLFGHSTTLATTQFSTSQANRILYLHLDLTF